MPTKSTSFQDDVNLTAGIGERISEAYAKAGKELGKYLK